MAISRTFDYDLVSIVRTRAGVYDVYIGDDTELCRVRDGKITTILGADLTKEDLVALANTQIKVWQELIADQTRTVGE